MSFVLRQVTRRTGGGDIVRTRTLTSSEPVIGRGADADIPLGDLAVSLRHAVLRQGKPGRVVVEALGKAAFEANGETVTRAELKLADAPVLVFGAFRLTLEPGEAGEVIVTVAKDEAAEGAGAGHEGAFSLSSAVFSKRRLAWTLAALILLVGLAWPVAGFFAGQNKTLRADAQWSSGPLSKAHAFLEDDCQACHQKAFVAVRDDACMTCHEAGEPATVDVKAAGSPVLPRLVRDHADHERMMRGTPLPGDFGGKVEAVFRRAFNRPDDRCGSCHLEHALPGEVPALVAVNGCADCHADMKGRLKDTGLADVADWGKHPEFRPMVGLQRVSLTRKPREASGLTFPHRLHVSQTGGVARMAQTLRYGAPLACADCHRPDPTGRGFAPVVMERDCASCHSLAFARVGGTVKSLPHGEPELVVAALSAHYGGGWRGPSRPRPGVLDVLRRARERADALNNTPAEAASRVRAAFSPGGACFDCHKVVAPTDGSLDYRVVPVKLPGRYLTRGAFDHSVPEHRKDAKGVENCAGCHAAETSDNASDLMLPPIAECAACHGKTKAQVHAPAGSDCAECHSYHAPGTPARKPPKG